MRTWLLFGLCLAFCACGGGGGGDDGPLIQGLYAYVGAINQGSSPRYWTRFGDADVEDAVATITGVFSADGLLNSLTESYELTVDDDGTLTLVDLVGSDPEATGKARDDGRLAVCTATTGSADIHMFLRRDGENMDDSDFQGDYHRVTLSGTGDVYTSILYDVIAHGDGTSSRTAGVANSDGTANILCPGGSDTYTVAPNGQLTYTSSGREWRGQLTPDGVFGILGGTMEPLSAPGLMLLLRTATAATDGTLSGTYCLIGFGFIPSTDEFTSSLGELVADGVGGYTLTLRVNEGAGLGAPSNELGAYEVDADGTLEVTPDGSGGPALIGAVSADGELAILWGGTQNGSSPEMYLLFRL